LDEKREFEERRDDILKQMHLPMSRALPVAAQAKAHAQRRLFADPFLEGLPQLNLVPPRLEQRIALLRHVEALRLYAAEHKGTLPATLSEVSVPLPGDPFTGKPFHYDVRGGIAHLNGTPPPGEEKNPGYNIHCEVTLRK
jgi:hypothetical protein